MTNLDSLTLNEWISLIKSLKKYSKITSQIWNRWKKIFFDNIDNKIQLTVEYSLWLNKDEVLEQALQVYIKSFKKDINIQDITLVIKNDLIWGMRVFYWDNMIDMSFKRILQNI